MNQFNNHIYYHICEKSYEIFEKSGCATYRNYCTILKNSIKLEDISRKQARIIIDIHNYLQIIYGISVENTWEYILNYFLEDKCLQFEEAVRTTKIYFKNSFI